MHKASRVVAVLRRFRELAGLTQKDMAIRTGIPESTIQKIESGKSEMKLSQLSKYMNALEITLIDIDMATQRGDYILEKDIAAAARLLSPKERRALLRFIYDMRQ